MRAIWWHRSRAKGGTSRRRNALGLARSAAARAWRRPSLVTQSLEFVRSQMRGKQPTRTGGKAARGALADFKLRAPAWPRLRARGDSDSPSSRQLWLFRFGCRVRVLGTGSHGRPGPWVAPIHVERQGLLCQLLRSAPPLSGSTWRQKNSGRVGSCWPPSALRNSGPGRSRASRFAKTGTGALGAIA